MYPVRGGYVYASVNDNVGIAPLELKIGDYADDETTETVFGFFWKIYNQIQDLKQQNIALDQKLDSVFQSASKGKESLAGVLTNGGVPTDKTDTFETIKTNIGTYGSNRYNSGYSQGVTDADARVNTSSTNYKSGYNSGFAAGKSSSTSIWDKYYTKIDEINYRAGQTYPVSKLTQWMSSSSDEGGGLGIRVLKTENSNNYGQWFIVDMDTGNVVRGCSQPYYTCRANLSGKVYDTVSGTVIANGTISWPISTDRQGDFSLGYLVYKVYTAYDMHYMPQYMYGSASARDMYLNGNFVFQCTSNVHWALYQANI